MSCQDAETNNDKEKQANEMDDEMHIKHTQLIKRPC